MTKKEHKQLADCLFNFADSHFSNSAIPEHIANAAYDMFVALKSMLKLEDFELAELIYVNDSRMQHRFYIAKMFDCELALINFIQTYDEDEKFEIVTDKFAFASSSISDESKAMFDVITRCYANGTKLTNYEVFTYAKQFVNDNIPFYIDYTQ